MQLNREAVMNMYLDMYLEKNENVDTYLNVHQIHLNFKKISEQSNLF